MKIKSRVCPAKTEYHRKRNKCPCCTRPNFTQELRRRQELKEAMKDMWG